MMPENKRQNFAAVGAHQTACCAARSARVISQQGKAFHHLRITEAKSNRRQWYAKKNPSGSCGETPIKKRRQKTYDQANARWNETKFQKHAMHRRKTPGKAPQQRLPAGWGTHLPISAYIIAHPHLQRNKIFILLRSVSWILTFNIPFVNPHPFRMGVVLLTRRDR